MEEPGLVETLVIAAFMEGMQAQMMDMLTSTPSHRLLSA
jgi:hypothetical protein